MHSSPGQISCRFGSPVARVSCNGETCTRIAAALPLDLPQFEVGVQRLRVPW